MLTLALTDDGWDDYQHWLAKDKAIQASKHLDQRSPS